MKRDYGRIEELPPRSRSVTGYGSRVASERRTSYRNDYPSRESGYIDLPRGAPRPSSRRAYVEDGYDQRFERPPPPSYREGRSRDYDSVSGSKRPYPGQVSMLYLFFVPHYILCIFSIVEELYMYDLIGLILNCKG